ncbi:MAG: 3-deoxy-manno-octulosonate cytidylyltransferase [bacterium]
MKTTVLGVIPARWGSTRLPGKMMVDIAGKPLILHTLLNASHSSTISRLMVATDDERIAGAVRDAGFETVMTDPNLPSGSDRVWAVAKDQNEKIIVNIQGDEPLLPVAVIDRTVALLTSSPQFDVTTAACPLPLERHADPGAVKVVTALDGRALYFSRSPIPYGREGKLDPSLVRLHVGLYVFRRDALKAFCSWKPTPLEQTEKLEQLRMLEHGMNLGVVDVPVAGRGVDTQEDLELVRRALGG